MRLFRSRADKEHEHKETTALLGKKEGESSHGTTENGEPLPFFQSRTFGVLLITLSAISYGLSATMVSMESDLATPLVVGARYLGAFFFTAIVCIAKRTDVRVPREHTKILLIRSTFGLISFACGTYAFQNMPVGEATVLISMAPVFVAMFSACFLGESISCVSVLLIILSLSGVVLIVDPDSLAQSNNTLPKLNLLAAAAALCQALSKAVSYIFIKRSNNKIDYLTMIFWYALFGFTCTSLFTIIGYCSFRSLGKDTSPFVNHIDSRDYIYLSVISLLGFISQLTLTKATQLINTTIVSLIRNTDILVTMVFQIFYFHDVPCWLQVLGMVIMVIATLLILASKERERIVTNHPRCFPDCNR
ncbi:hypothetical protein ACHWQZ_G011503 [Mnemiopsis leidyi]